MLDSLSRFGKKTPIAVIMAPTEATGRRTFSPRVSAIRDQVHEAGVTDVRVCITGQPSDRIDVPEGVTVMKPRALAKEGRRRALLVTRWDQYHLSAEWTTSLLEECAAQRRATTHENNLSPLTGHLSLRCGAMALPPGLPAQHLQAVAAGAWDATAPSPYCDAVGLELEVMPIDARNVVSFYRRSAHLDVPTAFVVEANSSCNYKCYMCPYHGGRQRKKPTFLTPDKYADLDLDVFRRVVDEIAAMPRPYEDEAPIMVSPYRRGEFLLYPNWREALTYIKSKPNLSAYFSTNGSLWTDEDIDFVLDVGLDRLQVSIEGHDMESHRKIRLNKEFEHIASTIRKIVERRERRGLEGPVVQLAHTVNERNASMVDDYVKFWLHKVDGLFIGPENYADDDNDNKQYKVEFSPVQPRPDSERPPCHMIMSNVWIDAEGTAILCIGSKLTQIGSVHESSIAELLSSPARMEVLERHAQGRYDEGVCKNCQQWYSAYGTVEEQDDHSLFLSPDTQYYTNRGPIELEW